jgi:hypothetical protein
MRPALTGPEMTHDTADGHFKIHWTNVGDDAFTDQSADDADHNGVPDAVDAIEAGLTGGRNLYVVQEGWPEAPADAGTGGDDRLDIYVRKIDSRGYAYVRTVDPGRLDMWIEINPKTWPAQILTSVAAHELHHTFQFSYIFTLDPWIYEATSTWAQYRFIAMPELPLALARDLLWQFRLGNPERSLTVAEGQLHYAAFTWWKFLIDAVTPGDVSIVRQAFVQMKATGSALAGLDAVLAPTPFGSVRGAFPTFAEWQWFACADDDGHHYVQDQLACQSKGALGEHAYTTKVPTFPATLRVDKIEPLATGYVEFVPDCTSKDLSFTITPDSGGEWGLRVVEVPPANAPAVVRTIDLPAAQATTVTVPDWTQRRRVLAIVTHLGGLPMPLGFGATATVSGTYAPGPTRPVFSVTVTGDSVQLAHVGDRAKPAVTIGYGGTCEDGKAPATWTWTTADPKIAKGDGPEVVATGVGLTSGHAVVDGVMSPEMPINVVAPKVGSPGGGCGVGGDGGLVPGVILLAFAVLRARRRRASRSPS